MNLKTLAAALIGAGVLAACGGGGSSSSTATDTVSVQLAGVAGKGRIKRADVKAYEVDSNGVRATNPVATSTTSDLSGKEGDYSLAFSGKKGSTYVVEVTANANTTELNEVLGEQPLPTGFKMRTAIVAPTTAPAVPIQATVTPFSEMAIKAAEGATGGLKPANIEQAVATVSTMVGFNPVQVDLSSSSDTNKAKMVDLLTAVAALANGGTSSTATNLATEKAALGCGEKTGGEAVQCVVEKLASKASLTETKLTDAAVTTALSTAISTALPSTSEVKTVVTTNLLCTEGCTAPSPTVYSAVQAAKNLFATLRTNINADLKSLSAKTPTSQSSGNDSAYLQAKAMEQALNQATMPIDMVDKQLTAISTCLAWQAKYSPAAGDVSGSYPFSDGFGGFGCEQNQARLTVGITYWAAAAEDGKYYRNRHVFSISSAGSNAYTYFAKSGVFVYPNVNTPIGAVLTASSDYPSVILGKVDQSTGVASGAGSFTLDRSSGLLSLTAAQLPGRFRVNSFNFGATDPAKALQGGLNVGKVVVDGSFVGNISITGEGAAKNGVASPKLDVTLKVFGPQNTSDVADESLNLQMNFDVKVTNSDGKPTGLKISKLEWASKSSKLSGSLEMANFANDLSGVNYSPTSVSFSGSLSNSADQGVNYVPFLTGKLSVTVSGWSAYNDSIPESASNTPGVTLDFSGTVTAPSRPVMTLTVSATGTRYEGPTKLTAQLKSTVSSADRYAMSMTADKSTGTVTISESGSNLSMKWVKDESTVEVKKGTENVANIDMDTSVITYADKTFEKL